VIFNRRIIGEIVLCLPDKKKNKKFAWLCSCHYCADRAQNLMYSECSRFHSNRFTSGRVIAECVITGKKRHKVDPILDSSRIKIYFGKRHVRLLQTPAINWQIHRKRSSQTAHIYVHGSGNIYLHVVYCKNSVNIQTLRLILLSSVGRLQTWTPSKLKL